MQSLLERALEHAPVAVLVAEAPAGRVVYANARAADLLADGGVTGALEVPIGRALAGVPVTGVPVWRRRPDGTLACHHVDATPLHAGPEAGGVVGAVVTVHDGAGDAGLGRDVRSWPGGREDGGRPAGVRTERLDAVHSRLLAALSHEIRTPLTAVVGYSDMLDAELAGPLTAAQRHQVERIRTSAWQTITVLEQALAYASAEAGSLELQPARADLCELVREAMLLQAAHAERRGVHIDCELPAAPVTVITDAGRVRQIIEHLVDNAVKFTDGMRVRVVGQQAAGVFRVSVQDDGPGIDAGKRGVIFELFQRDGVQHSADAGAGVGLPVSRQLARLLGGELSLDEPAGRGSRFVLDLPLAG